MSMQFWATVCKTVRRMLSDCLSVLPCPVLSIMLVYCGQTVGWIMTKFGMEVGLDPSDIMLDGNPAPGSPFPKQGPQFSAHIYCGQDATRYGGRPRPRPHCAGWVPSSSLPKGAQPRNFRPISVAKRSPISATAEHLFRRY